MRVLLVQSWLGGAEPPVYPAGLACLAAALPGHEVRVADPNVEGDPADPYPHLLRLVDDFKPQVIGISLRNIDSTNRRVSVDYYSHFRQLVRLLRERTDAALVVGGAGYSLFAERILRENPELHCGVYLEGEDAFPRLLERLDRPWTVPGIYYRQGDAVLFSGEATRLPADRAPWPEVPVPVSLYAWTPGAPEPLGVETKRGCALGCVYCPYGFLNGRGYRLRDPVAVADHIERLHRQHGMTRFTFLDSVFNIPKSHAKAICRELVRRRLPVAWSAWFNERELDREFLELCLDAGCQSVILSPDGFSDQSLQALGKSLSKQDILRAWRLLADLAQTRRDFHVSYNFFKNPPGQTWGAFLALVWFLFRAKWRLRGRVHVEVNTLRVEPHTRLHALALAEGLCTPETDLLAPVHYTQRRTVAIERLWNILLKLLGK